MKHRVDSVSEPTKKAYQDPRALLLLCVDVKG